MTQFTIVAGTYEKLLVGIDTKISQDNGDNSLDMEMSFGFAAHIGAVKTVAIGGEFLASGSSDEVIKLFNMKKKKELGSLHSHSGSIHSLKFYKDSHMISASSDGTIQLYRTQDFELLKTLKGHKGPVSDVAIHPSGSVALSIGANDKCVKLWNLTTGKCANSTRSRLGADLDLDSLSIKEKRELGRIISQHPDRIMWNVDGTSYGILFSDRIEITSISKQVERLTRVCYAESFGEKMLDFAFVVSKDTEDEFIISSHEDGCVRVWNVDDADEDGRILCMKAVNLHDCRIKSIKVHSTGDDDNKQYLITGDSQGEISVWDLNDIISLDAQESSSLARISIGSRITCLDAHTVQCTDDTKRGKAKKRRTLQQPVDQK
ncbi:hypothetical protein MP228_010380 [Amoeboaphelidium protococcarum]|nr:hypothetical protein MP228_010380 [Amoeboaphelidium protococcarum]